MMKCNYVFGRLVLGRTPKLELPSPSLLELDHGMWDEQCWTSHVVDVAVVAVTQKMRLLLYNS